MQSSTYITKDGKIMIKKVQADGTVIYVPTDVKDPRYIGGCV